MNFLLNCLRYEGGESWTWFFFFSHFFKWTLRRGWGGGGLYPCTPTCPVALNGSYYSHGVKWADRFGFTVAAVPFTPLTLDRSCKPFWKLSSCFVRISDDSATRWKVMTQRFKQLPRSLHVAWVSKNYPTVTLILSGWQAKPPELIHLCTSSINKQIKTKIFLCS